MIGMVSKVANARKRENLGTILSFFAASRVRDLAARSQETS